MADAPEKKNATARSRGERDSGMTEGPSQGEATPTVL